MLQTLLQSSFSGAIQKGEVKNISLNFSEFFQAFQIAIKSYELTRTGLRGYILRKLIAKQDFETTLLCLPN